MADIELVATCDASYLEPLETMLLSAATAHAGSTIRLWLIHSSIVESDVVHLRTLAARIGAGLELLRVDVDSFLARDPLVAIPRRCTTRLLGPAPSTGPYRARPVPRSRYPCHQSGGGPLQHRFRGQRVRGRVPYRPHTPGDRPSTTFAWERRAPISTRASCFTIWRPPGT